MQVKQVTPTSVSERNGVRDFSRYFKDQLKYLENQKISFSPGEYHFYPDFIVEKEKYISNTDSQKYPYKKYALNIENCHHIQIVGNQTQWIIHGDMGILAILSSQNIIIENIKITYATPNVIDLKVEKVIEQTAYFLLPNNYEVKIQEKQLIWQSDRSPYTGEHYWSAKDGLDLTQCLEKSSGQVYRLSEPFIKPSSKMEIKGALLSLTDEQFSCARPGDVYQLRETPRKVTAGFINLSKEITFFSCHFCFFYDMGIVSQMSETLTFDTCSFTPEKGYYSSSCADTLHFSSCRGVIVIQNCCFKNPHDDMINIHGTFLKVKKVQENKLVVSYVHPQTLGFPPFLVGDQLQFYQSQTLLPLLKSYEITKIMPVCNSLTDYQLTLKEQLPKNLQVSEMLASNLSTNPTVRIEECLFEKSPTRAILVTTSGHVLIQKNFFTHIFMAAIFISCDGKDWYESGPTKNVVVRENQFTFCHKQAVCVEPTNEKSGNQKIHGKIFVQNNQLKQMEPPYFSFKSTEEIQVKDNYIENEKIRDGIEREENNRFTINEIKT